LGIAEIIYDFGINFPMQKLDANYFNRDPEYNTTNKYIPRNVVLKTY